MRKYLLAITSLFCVELYAAETIVYPFEINFRGPRDQYRVEAKLYQRCRYERIVWSDSAEYETKVKELPLIITKHQGQDEDDFRVELRETQRFEITGWMRPTKECMSELKIVLLDRAYSVGWGGQFERPLSFTLSSPAYRYRAGTSVFEPGPWFDKYEEELVSFDYRPNSSQVNIWLLIGGERDHDIFPISAARNPETNAPYRLRGVSRN